jgi:hypothetical protein
MIPRGIIDHSAMSQGCASWNRTTGWLREVSARDQLNERASDSRSACRLHART